jgi:hypothetical protein
MTEVERYEPPSQVAVADPTGGRLVAWAAAAAAANQLAKALSRTSFVPAAFKGNEYDATAAIIMGDEVGLSPLAALRSIYVVHGTPAMYARTMVALVQSRGHEVWTELSTDAKVVVCGRRKGSDKVEHSEWTTARAQKAGYTTNKKYATNAQEMLYSKASAEICRKVGADVLLGIPYSVEDLELEQPAPTITASRTTERKTTAKRAAPVAEEPEFEPSGMDEFAKPAAGPPSGAESGWDSGSIPDPLRTPPAETGEAITAPQSKMLHALLNKNDLGDRDAGLAYIGGVIGREIDTSKDLTKAEASVCIDRLSTLEADDKEPTQAVLDEIAAGK